MKHELVELGVHLIWGLDGCVFEPWLMQNKFLFSNFFFCINVKGQKP